MKVAVVIVNYNSGALLEECLTWVRDQTLQPDRIIVVDNHSTDVLEDRLLSETPGIEIIHMPRNVGYGAAINKATMRLRDCDYVFCLNPDAFPAPDCLQQLTSSAEANPDYGSFATLMLSAEDPSVIDGAGDVLHISGLPWRRYHGRKLSEVSPKSGQVFSACAGACLYRLSAFREVGGFDESFFMYVEDVDLGFRLRLAGYPCLFVEDAVVRHIGSAITGRRSDFSVYHGHRNLVWCYFKNLPVELIVLLMPLHLLMTIVTGVRLTLQGGLLPFLRAKRDAIMQIGRYAGSRFKGDNRNVLPDLQLTFRR